MHEISVTRRRAARVSTVVAAAAMAATFTALEAQTPASPLKVFCFTTPNNSGFVGGCEALTRFRPIGSTAAR